jgi:2'-5' RNA ligase
MASSRIQLTLFVNDPSGVIEGLRAAYNPVQHGLIAAHVTLCREDELGTAESVMARLRTADLGGPLTLRFGPVARFSDGKGAWLPPDGPQPGFDALRQAALGLSSPARPFDAHITLLHPRNATCTDAIFAQLQAAKLPRQVVFDRVHLIRQQDGGIWELLGSRAL